ncbi:hypothetical protein E2C01_062218 [Portunus trituberculatus]|uniref:Uncharacterized protein n=1 Tax=Portunus trituberculatus TaxID=210409 RepID=A0A5B7HGH1_PORTR|nr:hypothetical protein [Portunus trituberculatus]
MHKTTREHQTQLAVRKYSNVHNKAIQKHQTEEDAHNFDALQRINESPPPLPVRKYPNAHNKATRER